MNTSKYRKYNFSEAEELFKEAENAVFPVEFYAGSDLLVNDSEKRDAVGKSAEDVLKSPSANKLNAFLTESYTVIATEYGELFGLASMDKQGNIGLLYAKGGSAKKTAKLLIRALERLAAKKNVPVINAVPGERTAKIFKDCGYAPKAEAGKSLEGFGGVPYTKCIKPDKPPVDFPPSCAKKIVLDARKPIREERGDGIFPFLFFGVACFFVLLFVFIILTNKGNVDKNALILVGVMVGIIFVAASVILAVYIVRMHKFKIRVLAGSVTNGVITDLKYDEYWTRSGLGNRYTRERYVRVDFTYVYYDGQTNLCTGRFKSKYKNKAPSFYYGQEVIVAYSEGRSCILSKYTVLEESCLLAEQPVEGNAEEEASIFPKSF